MKVLTPRMAEAMMAATKYGGFLHRRTGLKWWASDSDCFSMRTVDALVRGGWLVYRKRNNGLALVALIPGT